MVCQKDVKIQKHHELDLPNLHVIKALLSMKSRGHVREVFSWQWHYFFLTDSGIQYLKEYLHLPEDVVPATLKRAPGAPGGEGGFGAPRRDFGDRPRDGGFGRKDEAPAAGFRPSYAGGAAPARA
jgi:small subunit ribosomal protein S10e